MKIQPRPAACILLCLASSTFAFAQSPNLRIWGSNANAINGQAFSQMVPAQVGALSGITAISGGEYHSLALKSDGTVWSWGGNASGQLGNGSNANSNVPVPVTGLAKVIAIAAGDSFSLALAGDGTVWAWGANSAGQLGSATNIGSNLPVPVSGLTAIKAIAAGSQFALALKTDGTVWTWGEDASGQLGNGVNTTSNVPVAVSGLTGVTAVAAGQDHALALKTDGTIWAWGDNSSGELGNGTTQASNVPVRVTQLIGGASIAAGNRFSLALLQNNGTVVGWGNNFSFTLGDGNQRNSEVPVPVSSLTAITSIAANNSHALALGSNGLVWSWGTLDSSQYNPSPVPVQVSGLNSVIAIAAGTHHFLALKNDGTVWTWGDNADGELGNATSANSNVPVTVAGLTGVAALADADYHSFALLSDGTLRAWGADVYGVLGNGSYDPSAVPVPVIGLTDVVAVGGGRFHSLAVKSDGTVWAWGGYMGNGPPLVNSEIVTSNAPVQVNGLSDAIAVTGGWNLSMVLKNDGTVWAWQYYEPHSVVYSPSQVEGLSNIIAIAAFEFNAPLALKSDGTVWYWPEDTKANMIPVAQVTGLAGVVAIAAGNPQALALKSDGTVWTWSNDLFGQPGVGMDPNSNLPVQVTGLPDIVAIAAGDSHNLALAGDGTVWAWGSNFYGQLGDGGNADSAVPVQVSGLTNVISIAAGESISLAALSGSFLPQITASEVSLNFESVPQGTSSAPQTLTISNNGNTPFTTGSMDVLGINSGDFAASGNCNAAILQPGQSCTISVTFKPAGQGSRSAALMLTANATGSPIRVMLSGTGTSPSGSGTPSITAVVSASAFGGFQSVAPGSWIEIYGLNLAPEMRLWSGSDFDGNNAPTSLDGVSVSIGGQKSFVDYISASQMNAQIPSNIATGGSLPITVTNSSGTSQPFNINVNTTQPGLLAPADFKIAGSQYVVAQLPDGSYAMPAGAIPGVASRPAKPGETVLLYGIGFGSVTPDIPAGQIVTESNQLSTPLQIFFGSKPAHVSYAGLAPNLIGLYQFNVVVPSVPDSNLVSLTFTLGAAAGSQTLYTAVHQ